MPGEHQWASGDVLKAADLDSYLMDQVIAVFANAASRDSNITSPTEGQACYTQDTNTVWLYDGSSWQPVITNQNNSLNWSAIVMQQPDSAVDGAAPSSGTPGEPFGVQAGTFAGAVASGELAVTFPQAFPNGLLVVVATPTNAGGGFAFCTIDSSKYAANHFYVVPYTAAGAVIGNGTTIRLNYIAIGF